MTMRPHRLHVKSLARVTGKLWGPVRPMWKDALTLLGFLLLSPLLCPPLDSYSHHPYGRLSITILTSTISINFPFEKLVTNKRTLTMAAFMLLARTHMLTC
jgi:hypothetical protein